MKKNGFRAHFSLVFPALAPCGSACGSYIDDPNVFTFVCENAVLAKWVNMGYTPWLSVTECWRGECTTQPMREMCQACTRMMRANDCGDETSHTHNGTLINTWDDFDIQLLDSVIPASWTDEAECSPHGAVCVQQVRWPGSAEPHIDAHCPHRWDAMNVDCFSPYSIFYYDRA